MVFTPGEGVVLRSSGHGMAYPETKILVLRCVRGLRMTMLESIGYILVRNMIRT